MTGPAQTPYVQYVGNSIATVYPLTFFAEPGTVSVRVNTQVVNNWDLVGQDIIFSVPPETNAIIEITRSTPLERLVDYQTTDNSFRPVPVNRELDRAWRALQELWFQIQRLSSYFFSRDTFLEIVASTSFAEPSLEFGRYVTRRPFKLNQFYPNIAECDTTQRVEVRIYRNITLVAAIVFEAGDTSFVFIESQPEFQAGDVLTMVIHSFHYTLTSLAVTLIGKFPIYELGE